MTSLGVIAVTFLLLFPGAPGRAGITIEIDSPLDGPLSGMVVFEVSYDNPDGKNLTVSLFASLSGTVLYELLDQEAVDKRHGYVSLDFDTSSVDNGDYVIKAVADADDENAESKPLMFTVYNPKDPVIKWAFPGQKTVLKGQVQLKVNVTGDHGGLVGGPSLFYRMETAAGWTALGEAGNVVGTTLWRMDLDTMDLADGSYYLMANVTSVHGKYSEAVIGPNVLDNEHTPNVTLISPSEGTVIVGNVQLKARASDPDGNINPEGVVFYYSKPNSEAMTRLGNDPDADKGVHALGFDSTRIANGRYKVWAYVRDSGTPSTSCWNGVNVTVRNPLIVQDVRSIGRDGEAWAFEVVIKEGPMAYPLNVIVEVEQGSGWMDGGASEIRTQPIEAGPIKVRVDIPLTDLKEGNVSVRAKVVDIIGAEGSRVCKDLFAYHPMVVPRVRVLPPQGVLVGNASIFAEVVDDDVPLQAPVMFHYSTDNKTWRTIGIGTFFKGRTYRVVWDTSLVSNFSDYHIKVNHTDSDGLTGEGFSGGFEVRNERPAPPPPPPPKEAWYETEDGIMSLMGIVVLVAAILAVVIALIVGATRRSARRREKRRKIEAERERLKGIDGRAKARDSELKHMLTVGSKFQEPVRRPTPRGAVPLRPAERGIIKPPKVEAPKEKPKLQEFEHPPGAM